MPQVSTIISGAASIGVLAGVVSGIFYLVLTGIRWAGRVRAALQEEEERRRTARCAACGRSFSVNAAKPVICVVCGRQACFDLPCSRPAAIGWTCVVCHVKRNADSSSGSWTDVKSDEEVTSSGERSKSDSDTVREFIEHLVEKIVGGPLDGVSVGKLSNHAAYNEMFSKYHEPLCQALARMGFSLQLSISSKTNIEKETPSSAHSALSQLIEKIVKDALGLPKITETTKTNLNSNGTSSNSSGIDGKTYEDILSTAILNKIIEKYQSDEIDQNKNLLRSRRHQNDDNDDGDDNDSDWSNASPADPLALKIEEHIEEVTTTFESSSEEENENDWKISPHFKKRVPFPEFGVDIVDGSEAAPSSDADSDSCTTDIISSNSTWEENWLFQKKKLKSSAKGRHPVPVPMLVPNPSQEFRALIGGIDADDISDLSECSDSALEEAMSEVVEDPAVVQEIIDALNQDPSTEELTLPDESTSRSEEAASSETILSEIRTVVVDGPPSSDTQVSSPDSLEAGDSEDKEPIEHEESPPPSPSLIQQDRDFPVDYETITQIDRPPVPKPRTLDLVSTSQEEPERFELEEKPMFCPIAEREKAKWNNAVEMKHNPYTPENIAKRVKNQHFMHLNGSSSDSIDFPAELTTVEEPEDLSRKYSRDFYIKASRSPTGEQPPRSTDSPISIRSETSLEDSTLDDFKKKIEGWRDLPATTPNIRPTNSESEERKESIDLPKVKELKENFLAKKPPIPVRSKSAPPNRTEPEIDYSTTPISDIITNLTNKSVPEKSNKELDIFEEVAQVRRESQTKIENSEATGSKSSHLEVQKLDDSPGATLEPEPVKRKLMKPIKPVHSLTARSIPKDFREGLKKSNQKITKANVIGHVFSEIDDNSLMLNFDVKGKRKFWENMTKGKS